MNKVLMIVPSYNEELNLEIVANDIKENFSEADILFINDCSKDDTLNVIKSIEGVSYLDLPINLGYSYAVQTGLKYAVQDGYDYLIQFDGDGQHLASEAKKMYKHALETDADIVIGSRFLSTTNYQHSFFERWEQSFFKLLSRC